MAFQTPANLQLNVISHNRIDATWRDDQAYDTLIVYRGTSSPPGDAIHSFPPPYTQTSWSDTTCVDGIKYYYRIWGNLAELNGYSSTENATTTINAPTSPSFSGSGYTTGNLSWTNGESDYDNVYIQHHVGSDAWAAYATMSGSATSKSCTGLEEGRIHYFRLYAKKGSVQSSYSSTASDNTSLHTCTGMTRTGVSSTQCNLSWTKGYSNYDHILVKRKPDGGSYSTVHTSSGSATSWNDTTISANQKYYWEVVPETNDVTASASSAVSYTGVTATQSFGVGATLDLTGVNLFGVVGTFGVSSDFSLNASGTYTGNPSFEVSTETEFKGSVSTRANFAYYMGDEIGNVYLYSKNYYSDNGKSIDAYYRTKPIDFSDSDEDAINRFKTVYSTKVIYKDAYSNMPLTLSISTDGGQNWDASSQIIGTGDGTTKDALFYFIKTGEYFDFKIESSSKTKGAWILALEVRYSPAGPYFGVQ